MTSPREHDLHPSFAVLLADLDLLLDGSISPDEFQTRVFRGHADLLVQTADGAEPDPDIYTRLWHAAEDYVDDPQLRAELVERHRREPQWPRPIGDEELRQAAMRARGEFGDILARIGYDQHGRKKPS